MKNASSLHARPLLAAAAGLLALLLVSAGMKPASAQAQSAEQLCTPDVMRLCSAFIPNPDPIVRCLKAKRRQLSPGCRSAMSPKSKIKRSARR